MGRTEVSESDRLLMETNLLRPAIRHIVALALNEQINLVGVSAKGVGQSLVEQVFAQKCEELYPDYLPLLTGRQSENDLKRYQTVLLKGGLLRSEKQGTRPKVMSREELAKCFDVSASQLDALVSRLESMGLLKVKEMRELGERKLEVTFREHPLERKLREWVRERGSEITMRVSDRSEKVKCLDRGILSTLARRWGAHFEEVNAALELAKVRGSLDYDERKVWEAVAEVNPDEIRSEAESLWKLLEPLRKHFPDDVRHHEKALDEIIALTHAEDEAQWDEARYKLGQESAALKEFVRQKSEQWSKELRQQASALHTMRVKLPTSDLEHKVELVIRLAEWLDDQRRRLHKDAQKLASDLQRAEDETERLAEQMERVRVSEELQPALKRLTELSELLSKVKETMENLSQRAEELHALTDGLKAWKALAREADGLRSEILEREQYNEYNDLRQRLDEWVKGVMEHFAEKQRDALRDHERFDYDLREIRAEFEERKRRERKKFEELVKTYEQQLMGITDAHLFTPYDPKDPKGSYERLADEVLQKLSEVVGKLGEFLRQDEARIAFLRVIRGRQTSDLEKMWGELEAKLNGVAQGVNLEVIKAFHNGDQRLAEICEALRQWRSRRSELRKKINDADKPLPLDADEEACLKLVREVAQRERSGAISLAHLWEASVSNRTVPPEKLLELVERLYRKGWIDIRLSEQK
jgi:predicted RNA-binding protein with PIN domain